METQDLIPRLVLFGGLTAILVMYMRRRQGQMKAVSGSATDVANAMVAEATDSSSSVVERGQHMVETALDSIAQQALKELKVVLKDGLKRLEAVVDEL